MFLRGTRLDYLSEAERQALKRVAFAKLQSANLGCTVNRPKGEHIDVSSGRCPLEIVLDMFVLHDHMLKTFANYLPATK